MPGQTTKITNREKAVILFAAAGLEDDWTELYLMAEDKSRKDAESVKFIAASVSRWRNSDKVKACLAEYKKMLSDREANARVEGREDERRKIDEENGNERGDSDRTDTRPPKRIAPLVDYSDPTNRKRLINEVIRDASDDPKTRLDAAKVFEQQQRDDKQAAKDNQIQRFYTPVTCRECPIKAAFAEKRRRKADQAEK